MSSGLNEGLLDLKVQLESLEVEMVNQMLAIEAKEAEWNKVDAELEAKIRNTKDETVTLNIGGKIFKTRLSTLISAKDSLFAQLIASNKLDFSNEVFIDRSYTYFPYIMSYLRNKKLVGSEKLVTKDYSKLLEEAQYYEIQELAEIITEILREIKFVKFETNGTYSSAGTIAGTNKIEDLNNHEDRSLKKGICATYPGWIIFELNRQVEWDQCELGGWAGNTSLWGASNGSSSIIYTSLDKTNWTQVGTIPSNFGSTIIDVSVIKSSCKYIKIQGSSYVGIGYFRIKKI
jgi:hypothetical protein